MRKKRIGFVGLGLMGSGMTKNLLSAGYSVIGYDIEEGKVDALVRKGGQKGTSPEQIPPSVDVIILSLPNSHVVNQVVKDSLRLFETGRKGLILIDTTTADPVMSEELAVQFREKGGEMLDATLSREATEIVEDQEIAVKAGDVLYIPAGEKHAIVNRSAGEFRYIEFFTHPPVKADFVEVKQVN